MGVTACVDTGFSISSLKAKNDRIEQGERASPSGWSSKREAIAEVVADILAAIRERRA